MTFILKNLDRIIAWLANILLMLIALDMSIFMSELYLGEDGSLIGLILVVLVVLMLPILASIFIKKKWLAIILFLLTAICIFDLTSGVYWFIALAYILVYILR